MPREKSAGAVIFREESFDNAQGKEGKRYYLLLHYEFGHWEFVKGHLEKDENEIETIKREALEEAGIKDIEIIDGFKETMKYFFRQYKEKVSEKDRRAGKTTWVFKMVVFYLAKTETKDIKISKEHKDFVWLPYKEAVKKITYKNSKEILKKADDFIKKQNI